MQTSQETTSTLRDDVSAEEVPTAERRKCEHGVYIPKGETTSVYCTGCNPGFARIMVPHRRVVDVDPPEHDVDAAEYLEAPVWERLEAAERMESVCL